MIEMALRQAEEKNGKPTTIAVAALNSIVHLSEGYPHFIQQFGYCAFQADKDDNISVPDVIDGAYGENGALEQLGRKFFREMYFEKVSSGDYRKVLDAMAQGTETWYTRNTIIKRSGVKETQVNNALNALKKRGIIIANEDNKGEYRLPTRSFAVWIKAYSQRNKKIEGSGFQLEQEAE